MLTVSQSHSLFDSIKQMQAYAAELVAIKALSATLVNPTDRYPDLEGGVKEGIMRTESLRSEIKQMEETLLGLLQPTLSERKEKVCVHF